jgi:hypothetical protein
MTPEQRATADAAQRKTLNFNLTVLGATGLTVIGLAWFLLHEISIFLAWVF